MCLKLGFFKIQAGIHLVAAIFFSIGINSLMANVSLMTNVHFTRGFIITSNVFILSIWLTALMGMIKKNVFASTLALVLWSLYICLWVGAVTFSMFALGKMCMCSYGRCPESMWLLNNSWHIDTSLDLKKDYELDPDYKIKPVKNPEDHNRQDADHYSTTPVENFPVPPGTLKLDKNVSFKSFEDNYNNAPEPRILNLRSSSARLDTSNDNNNFQVRTLNLEQREHPKNRWSLAALIITIIVVFGVMMFGWLVLYAVLLELKHEIKICPPVEFKRKNTSPSEFAHYCPKRKVCPNYTHTGQKR